MGNFIKIRNPFKPVEDRPTPSAVYNWRIYVSAMLATTSSILIGYDTGFIGGTTQNKAFLDTFNLDFNTSHGRTVVSNIISCFHMGAFGGALLAYPIQYYYGNRMAMLVGSFWGAAGSAIMMGCVTGNLVPLYLGRVISGMCVGTATNVTIVYLSEISPAPIRGQIVAIFEIGWRIGDLVGFWINYGIVQHVPPGNRQWIIPMGVQLVPAGLFFIGSFFLKESPRWLAQKNRKEEAMNVLSWLRKLSPGNEYFDWEFSTMCRSIEEQHQKVGSRIQDPFLQIMRDRTLQKRMGIAASLLMLANFMGIQSINYYSVTLFKMLGIKGQNASMYSTGFLGVMKFGCTIIYVGLIVDSVGRRPAFLVSALFCSIWFWYIGAYLKVSNVEFGGEAGPGGRAAIGAMYMWVASYLLAYSGGPFVWAAEVFDQSIRQFTQSINAALSWLPIFIMSKATADMISSMHYGTFFFFACIDILMIPFVFFCVPETKGIPLEKIDMLFEDGVPAWKAHSNVLNHLKMEQEFEKELSGWDGIYTTEKKETSSNGSAGHIEYIDHISENSGSDSVKVKLESA